MLGVVLRHWIKVLSAGCFMCMTSVYAQTLKSEQEVLHLFLQSNLSLIAGKANIDIARAQLITAQQLSNPNVSFNASGLGNAQGYSGGYWQQPYDNVLRIEQLIETAGKRPLRISTAELGLQFQDLQFKDLLRALTRDVKQAYYQVVLAQRGVAIYDEILSQLSDIQHANALRWKSGDISETEFRRSELEALKAKTDVEQAHLRLTTNRQLLAELLSHGTEWQLLSVSSVFPKRSLPAQSEQSWVRKAIDQRADLAATATLIQQQEKNVDIAEAQKIPDITAGLQYQHNTSAIVPDSTGIGVSVRVPLWHQYQGEVSTAKASKHAADVAWQLLSVQIKTQVSVALSQFRQKQNVLERYDAEMLSRAKQVRASSVLAYRQGAISLLELLDAEKNYRNTLLEYDQALFDQTAAWLDLMYAVGEEEKL